MLENRVWTSLFEALPEDAQHGVNPAICDSSTFAFASGESMSATFQGEHPAYLYARHKSPSQDLLARDLAKLEGAEAAHVMASGMGAIACALLQLCQVGDEVIASRTIYGGTYALLKNFLPRFGIRTHFVDMDDFAQIEALMGPHTKVLYCETISNPLLHLSDIPRLADLAHAHGVPLMVDNTFSPMMISPLRLGADIVVHSLTKFINGMSDGMGGVVCGSAELVASLSDVNEGAAMLLGPSMDAPRAQSIWKNVHTLHVRMERHAANAGFLATRLEAEGVRVHYPGLASHPHHERLLRFGDPIFGGGGLLVMDLEDREAALGLVRRMQARGLGYLAVSLGYFRSLFSLPGSSTSSEIPEDEQEAMGLSDAMVRLSVGLDPDIERTWSLLHECLCEVSGLVGV